MKELVGEQINADDGQSAEKGGGKTNGEFGQAEDGNRRNGQVDIDPRFVVTKRLENERHKNTVFVAAGFEDGVGIVAQAGLVPGEAGWMIAQVDRPEGEGEKKNGGEEKDSFHDSPLF